MSTQFRPEELKRALRPPTDDEVAAMRHMPVDVAVGWLERKRARELCDQHGKNNMAEGLEVVAAELRKL